MRTLWIKKWRSCRGNKYFHVPAVCLKEEEIWEQSDSPHRTWTSQWQEPELQHIGSASLSTSASSAWGSLHSPVRGTQSSFICRILIKTCSGLEEKNTLLPHTADSGLDKMFMFTIRRKSWRLYSVHSVLILRFHNQENLPHMQVLFMSDFSSC